MAEDPGGDFARAIKHDAKIDMWVEQSFRVHPALNPSLGLEEPVTYRAGRDFRSHLIPSIEKNKHLTIAFGENLWIIDDPMEIMLILETRLGYRGLKNRLQKAAPPSSPSGSPSGRQPSSEAGSGASSDEG